MAVLLTKGLGLSVGGRDIFDHGRYQPDSSNRNLVARVQELASAKEVWFCAAVIAVPIAGGLANIKKGHVAKLDLECMVPVTGHENCCLTCDKMRQADLGNDKILSLVHWGMYSGHGKLELV